MSALKSSQLRTSVSVPDTGQADRQPSDRQHGFYARPSAHLPWLVTRAGLGAIFVVQASFGSLKAVS